ncbi:predicted protein, partial [Nematostella vectensis]
TLMHVPISTNAHTSKARAHIYKRAHQYTCPHLLTRAPAMHVPTSTNARTNARAHIY